jgi:hypothetical protein
MWFIWYLLRIDDPDEALPIFIAISKRIFIAVLVLAGVIALVGGLATVAAYGPQCAQGDPIELYGLSDFAGYCLGCCFMALMVSAAAWPTPENSERLKQSFARDTQIIQGPESFQMTEGVATAYCVLLALLGFAVLLTGIAISHSLTILNHCPLAIGPH